MIDILPNPLFENIQSRLNNCSYYQKLLHYPKSQRWLIIAGLFLLSQVIVFASLYLFIGKVAMIGFFICILSGLATGVGALPAVFFKEISTDVFNSLLGAAAGVMLAATAFSLLVPGIEFGNEIWPDKGLWIVAIGMLVGAVFLHLADRKLPHLHFGSEFGAQVDSLQKISLFIVAITIHNFPEGMSVGVSFGTGDMHNGIVLAIAVALQNSIAPAAKPIAKGKTEEKTETIVIPSNPPIGSTSPVKVAIPTDFHLL
jgi:ZIP family zinc transporter